MGKRIIAIAIESGQFTLVGAMEKAGHAEIGHDAGLLAGSGALNVKVSVEYPANADVMIDFSLPEATDASIAYCVNHGVRLVLGTTGLSESQAKAIKEASKSIAIVQATNMSVGMNVLFSLVGKAAKMLGPEYDVEIVEQHHRFKKDAPSGSALTLSKKVAEAAGFNWPACVVNGRNGKEALRQKNTIGMHAVRAGDITGEHAVLFSTLGETVTLSHSAHNRDNFVRGALRAASWLMSKKNGLYSMQAVLGLE